MTLFSLLSPSPPHPLSVLLHTILQRYLFDSYCITVVADTPIDFHFNLPFTYVVPEATAEELRDQLLPISESGCSDYIVNVADRVKFMTALDEVSRSGNTRRSNRKVVFLPPPGGTSSLDVFNVTETMYYANLLVISPNETDAQCQVFDLVTNKFVGPDEQIHEPEVLDQWDSCTEEFRRGANLFPHDISDMGGRSVRVATLTYRPYVILDVDPRVAPRARDGLEMRIVDEFCSWVNCTVVILNQWKELWGEVFDNGTGLGIIGRLLEDKADMGIGALYSWYEEYIHLDISSPSVRAAVTCVAPSPRMLASWLVPLMPFTAQLWCAVVGTFLLASGALAAARRSLDGAVITVLGVMISQAQKRLGVGWRERGVWGWLALGALVLASAYGGGLACTFTVPRYEPAVDSVADLVQRRLPWGATHEAWIFSLTLSTEPLMKQLVQLFRVYTPEELKKKSFERSMAFSIEKLPAGHFAVGDYLTEEALEDYSIMLEDFYYEQCVVMMRKSSPYTRKISSLIGRLHQAGLLLAWETQVALQHTNFKVQQEVELSRARRDAGSRPLDLASVLGIFTLYGAGAGLASLLFLAERLAHRPRVRGSCPTEHTT